MAKGSIRIASAGVGKCAFISRIGYIVAAGPRKEVCASGVATGDSPFHTELYFDFDCLFHHIQSFVAPTPRAINCLCEIAHGLSKVLELQ